MATPIGHPDDLTARARQVLAAVPVIAAEDTRVAARLLHRIGVEGKRLLSTHDHNEEQRTAGILEHLSDGRDVALISDAGTPLISDPGFRVVSAAVAARHPVVPVPGPCALVAALSASGLPTDRFLFLGFLDRRAAARRRQLAEHGRQAATLVLYEAPHRILDTLADLSATLGPRRVCLAVSLTKPWERFHRGTAEEVARAVRDEGEVLGEMTLVVEGYRGEGAVEPAAAEALVVALARAGVAPGIIRDAVSSTLGMSRREVYQAALRARE